MRINQNISAVNALRNLSVNETAQGKPEMRSGAALYSIRSGC